MSGSVCMWCDYGLHTCHVSMGYVSAEHVSVGYKFMLYKFPWDVCL